jgi:hypothetical protein
LTSQPSWVIEKENATAEWASAILCPAQQLKQQTQSISSYAETKLKDRRISQTWGSHSGEDYNVTLVMTLRRLKGRCQCFKETKHSISIFSPQNGDNIFLQNACICSTYETAWHHNLEQEQSKEQLTFSRNLTVGSFTKICYYILLALHKKPYINCCMWKYVDGESLAWNTWPAVQQNEESPWRCHYPARQAGTRCATYA